MRRKATSPARRNAGCSILGDFQDVEFLKTETAASLILSTQGETGGVMMILLRMERRPRLGDAEQSTLLLKVSVSSSV